MEYSFCADSWDCWYEWLWSSATAAWIQALFSLLAIAFTIGMWRHDRQAMMEHEDYEYHRNMAVAKTAFAVCMASLNRLEKSLKSPQFMATRRTVEKMEGELLDVVRAGLPDSHMMGYVYAMIARLSEILEFLERTSGVLKRAQEDIRSADFEKKCEAVKTQIRTFASDMEAAYDKIQSYQERRLQNPLAAWDEPGLDSSDNAQNEERGAAIQVKE
jgi:hypothetical protein